MPALKRDCVGMAGDKLVYELCVDEGNGRRERDNLVSNTGAAQWEGLGGTFGKFGSYFRFSLQTYQFQKTKSLKKT